MEIFNSHVSVPCGEPLGGYATPNNLATKGGELEVNGVIVKDAMTGQSYCVCALDALYPGDLARFPDFANGIPVFAASHTHSAPMLDSSKPRLGKLSPASLEAFRHAVASAPRTGIKPDMVRLFRGEVSLPVYRRFDRPLSRLNKFLTKYAGLFPNDIVDIDRGVYIWVFSQGGSSLLSVVYHACHPVTRAQPTAISADYVDALRRAVRVRFGTPVCLFLQGCSGDIRPNFGSKRLRALPRSRFNWRFKHRPDFYDEARADTEYIHSVNTATLLAEATTSPSSVHVCRRRLDLVGGGMTETVCLIFSSISRFEFMPFELSHFYNRPADHPESRRFLVSCAGHTLGYFPHISQISQGGYEVDASCAYMSLDRRLEIDAEL